MPAKNKMMKLGSHPCPEFLALQIRYFRNKARLTQKELSQVSCIKLRHLQKIEAGMVDLKLSTLGALSRGLGITPDTLLAPVKENINLMCSICRRNKRLLIQGN